MALSYVTTGTVALTSVNPTTSVAVTPPTHNAGDLLVAVLGGKPNATTQNNIDFSLTGWTDVSNGSAQGPAVNAAADLGGTRCKLLYLIDSAGTVTAAQTFTITSAGCNNAWGVIVALRSGNMAYALAGANGIDSTAGTPQTATMATDPGLTAGDLVLVATSTPTDTATFTALSFTATGISATPTLQIASVVQPSGIDSGGGLGSVTIDSGTSSAAATASFTITAGANVVGPIVIARVREGTAATLDASAGAASTGGLVGFSVTVPVSTGISAAAGGTVTFSSVAGISYLVLADVSIIDVETLAPPATAPALGGSFDETPTGGRLLAVSGGVILATARGGLPRHPTRGGVMRESSRGGVVLTGTRGGVPDESAVGGVHDLAASGGVVL